MSREGSCERGYILSSFLTMHVTGGFPFLPPKMAEQGCEGIDPGGAKGNQGAWDQVQAVSLTKRGSLRTSVISSVEWVSGRRIQEEH